MTSPARWHLPLVLAFVAALSIPKFQNDFVWDDLAVIVDGTVIHDWKNLPSVFAHRAMYVSAHDREISVGGTDTYRPITLATFFVDSAISGRRPFAYHATNLALHLAVVALLYALIRRLLPESPAWFAALVFGVSPHLAEAHVWINGRSDLVATLFVLAALLVALSQRFSPLVRSALVCGLTLFATLGKETAFFALPAIALAPFFGSTLRERVRAFVPFALAGLFYLTIRGAVLHGTGVAMPAERAWLALSNLPLLWLDGAREVLFPGAIYLRALVDDYAAVPAFARIVAAVFVAILAFAAWRSSRSVARWGLLFFLATLVPAALITTILWMGFGRFLYMPAVGLSLALADFSELAEARWTARRGAPTVLVAGALAYVALLSFRFVAYVGDWRDEGTLYSAIAREAPERAHGWFGLGIALRRVEAVEASLEPLARAAQLSRADSRALVLLATSFQDLAQRDRARVTLEEALRRFPHDALALTHLATLVVETDPARAADLLVECIEQSRKQQDCADSMMGLVARDANGAFRRELRRAVETSASPENAARLRPLFRARP